MTKDEFAERLAQKLDIPKAKAYQAIELIFSTEPGRGIIAGEEDTLIPVDESKKMHAANPSAEMVTVPRAGHLVNLEEPAVFNDTLRSFLSRL